MEKTLFMTINNKRISQKIESIDRVEIRLYSERGIRHFGVMGRLLFAMGSILGDGDRGSRWLKYDKTITDR